MDFEIGLIFIIGYLLNLSKSQTMMVYYSAPGQEYRRYYMISGNDWMKGFNMEQSFTYPPYGTPMSIVWYPSNPYYSTLNHIPKLDDGPSLGKYFLVYKNAYTSYHGPNLPKLETFRHPKVELDPIKHNDIVHPNEIDLRKRIFFEEYPHLKSLLNHQKTRIDNKLEPYKLGSLRMKAPFFRP